jgi:anti-sigma B factor antagonist
MSLSLPSLRAQARIGSGGTVAVEVGGELDLATADRFGDFLVGLTAGLSPRLVLDVSELVFCDPYGLSALVRAADRAEAVGGSVTLAGVRPVLARLLRLTRLERRLPVRSGGARKA